jgi:beta-lactamase regulating signal transducer with metallopeptidase domain
MHLLTQSALLQALGWSLFNSLWQMGLLWLLYQLLILLFGGLSAHSRHNLVLSFLAAGTLWVAVSFVSNYFMVADGTGFALEGIAGVALLRSFIAAVIPYGSSLYLLVLGGLLIRYCYHYFHSIKLTRQGLSRIQPGFRIFVEETGRRMGIRPVVRVWLSALVEVPVTLGFLKPVILLPLSMVSNLSPQQIEAILVHELAHIRRKDFLLNLAVTVAEVLFFFNPFTRWLIADLKKEREHCCDDLVLQFRYDPHAYVSALLSVARESQALRLVVAATGGNNNQLLLQRARRILQQQRTGDRPGARPFALLFLVLLLVGMTLSRPARVDASRVDASRWDASRWDASRWDASARTEAPVRTAGPELPTAAVARAEPERLTAAPGEMQSAPMISNTGTTPPPPVRTPRPAPRSHKSKTDAVLVHKQADEEETASEVNAFADNTTGTTRVEIVAAKEAVTVAGKDGREYSIGKPKTIGRSPVKEEGQPFVPKSSFSFQIIEEDSIRPEEKLIRLQLQTQREIALNMQKLQLDLMAQLELVKVRQKELQANGINVPSHKESLQLQRVLLEQQLQLQKQYIQRLDELQKKLKKVKRHLTIVYI